VAGNYLFFGDRGSNGYELWSSDRTSAGTFSVKDDFAFAPIELVDAGGTLFFNGRDAISGSELWKIDGSVAGTQQVADFVAFASGSSPRSLTEFQSNVYFTVANISPAFWKSDGTPVGTTLLRSLR
jgi:ELWxxDGT repeat protein